MRLRLRPIIPSVPALTRAAAIATALAAATPAARASHGSLICLAGGPYIEECSGGDRVYALDGSASRDPLGRPLSYRWSTDCPGATFDNPALARPRLTVPFQSGCESICEVELAIDNMAGKDDHCHASIVVRDRLPPVLDAAGAAEQELWPPDHRIECLELVDLGASTASDACSGPARIALTGCTVNEPSAPGDCQIAADAQSVCLRVERSGRGTGRSYQIEGAAEDECGNRSTPSTIAIVRVPHDQRRDDR